MNKVIHSEGGWLVVPPYPLNAQRIAPGTAARDAINMVADGYRKPPQGEWIVVNLSTGDVLRFDVAVSKLTIVERESPR